MKSPVQSSPVQTMIAAGKCWWRWWFNEPWRRGDFIVGGFIFTPHVDIFYFSNWLVLGCSSVLSRKLSHSSSPNKNRSWIYCVILDSCFSIGQWHRRCFPSTSLFLLNERTNFGSYLSVECFTTSSVADENICVPSFSVTYVPLSMELWFHIRFINCISSHLNRDIGKHGVGEIVDLISAVSH